MSEQRDHTTESGAGPRQESGRKPGSYYDDDATGYEIYQAEPDDEEDEAVNGES